MGELSPHHLKSVFVAVLDETKDALIFKSKFSVSATETNPAQKLVKGKKKLSGRLVAALDATALCSVLYQRPLGVLCYDLNAAVSHVDLLC